VHRLVRVFFDHDTKHQRCALYPDDAVSCCAVATFGTVLFGRALQQGGVLIAA
jgi:hypothetical protein